MEDTDPSGPVAASDAQPDGHAPAPDPWRHRILRLGAGAHLGTAPEVGGGLVPWTLFGADVVIAPIPELAIGVREVGGFGGQGPVFTANPVVEAAWRVHHRIALHAIVGCDLQLKLSTLGGESFSVAPRLGVGARVYADPIFSVALDLTGRVVVTDAFHTMSTALPSGAVLLTIGLSFAFHI